MRLKGVVDILLRGKRLKIDGCCVRLFEAVCCIVYFVAYPTVRGSMLNNVSLACLFGLSLRGVKAQKSVRIKETVFVWLWNYEWCSLGE